MEKTKAPVHYAWRAVILSSIMVFISLGFCSSAISIYTVPITEALGISRSAYATTASVRFISMALTNIFFGTLVHKFGTKRLMLLGFGALIASSLICSVANGLAVLLVGSIFLGIGLSFTSTTMVGTVINRHCKKHTGIFLGTALAMNGVGAAVARIFLTPIINAHTEGFKDSYRLVALIMLSLAIVIFFFFKESDSELHLVVPKKERKTEQKIKDVFHKPYLIVALVCVFLTGLILQSIATIADPHFKDNGIDLALVTTILTVYSVSISVGKASIGFIYDRTGLRSSLSICYGAALIATPALLFVSSSTLGISLGLIYSVFIAVSLPLQTVMLPIIVREFFGEKSFDKALGIFVGANVAGYAATPIADLIFDLTGSYDTWIIICTVLIIAVSITMNVITTLSKRQNS